MLLNNYLFFGSDISRNVFVIVVLGYRMRVFSQPCFPDAVVVGDYQIKPASYFSINLDVLFPEWTPIMCMWCVELASD